TYLNGQIVGQTGDDTPNAWSTPRQYGVPAGLLKPGRNTIAVRVFDRYGGGGFTGAPGSLTLRPAAGSGDPIPLAGEWKMHIEHRLDPNAVTGGNAPGRPRPPMGPDHSHAPSGLF